MEEIEADSNSTSKMWEDNTYRRWNRFSEPAVKNLLKLDIPIFVAVGSKDQAVPIESTFIIKTEFIRHHKTNLTYKVYLGYDHGFEYLITKKDELGNTEDKWMDVFNDFMIWVNTSKN